MQSSIPYFNADDVARATPMPALINALRDAFIRDSHHYPKRLAADISTTQSLLVMPAWDEAQTLGTKITLIDQQRRPSIQATYLLMDQKTGMPCALFDGTTLTKRRTAAASALAASILAQKHQSLLLIGTGALIPPLIEAYTSIFPFEQIHIWGRNREKANAVVEAMQKIGTSINRVDDFDHAISEADIISSATMATSPIIKGSMLHSTMHVDLIGAFKPDMCEADTETFAKADVYVDTLEGALSEAGDLIQAMAAGALTEDSIKGDMRDLCRLSKHRNDSNRNRITLFKSVGAAIEDLVAAKLAYRQLESTNVNAH
ncbi:ornithine cyclodeaminase family protein [Hyphococcus lacteus]|uniref:Ornithine cyclodeaminase family protein n=1 Tax=Hyphococcus lacteus TaxID=3143536 RepID=A0ABV3YZG3_9PROT